MEIRKVYPVPQKEKAVMQNETATQIEEAPKVDGRGLKYHIPLPGTPVDFAARVHRFETRWLKRALRLCKGNITTAARYLLLNRTTLHEKLKRRGLV